VRNSILGTSDNHINGIPSEERFVILRDTEQAIPCIGMHGYYQLSYVRGSNLRCCLSLRSDTGDMGAAPLSQHVSMWPGASYASETPSYPLGT